MENNDRVDLKRTLWLIAAVWVICGCFIVSGAKCTGGKFACEKGPDGTIRCEVEGHRH